MNVRLQRKMDRILGVLLCGFFSLFNLRDRGALPRTGPSNILIILLSEMGSLVLARPLFEHIKKKFPHASLHVLLFEQNREVLELLDAVPLKNIHTVSNRSMSAFILDSIHVINRLRRFKIDTVFDCELFSRISSTYSFLSGAKIRAGFHPYTQEGLFRGNTVNRRVLYNPYHHISHQFINLVEAYDGSGVPDVKRQVVNKTFSMPTLNYAHGEMNALRARLERHYPSIAGKEMILVYPSGGLLPIRAWPLRNFCLAAEDFIRKGYAVGIIGMKGDKRFAQAIFSYCDSPYCIDFTGYTKTVRELLLLFNMSSLLITNDGGPGHFASLTSVPAIILFGPETPLLYGPLDQKSYAFHASLSCSPCLTAYNHRETPRDGDNLCLKTIETEDVLSKAYEILEQKNV